MVRRKAEAPDTHKFYYYKPGQNAGNTKISERGIGILIPNRTYERYLDYVTTKENVALMAEREAKRLATLKSSRRPHQDRTGKGCEEKLVPWDKVKFEETRKFLEDEARKKESERAEVIRQAKDLLLSRRPHIRVINRALLASECFRELDEQVKFDAKTREMYEKVERENVRLVLEDVEKFKAEEQIKKDRIKNNAQAHKIDILKQIAENAVKSKRSNDLKNKSEAEDQTNMRKEIQDMRERDFLKESKKKEDLRKMFLEAIEERQMYKSKVQEDEKLQNEQLKVYKDLKREIDKLIVQKKREASLREIKKREVIGRNTFMRTEHHRLALEEKERLIVEQIEDNNKKEDARKAENARLKRIKAHENLKEQIRTVTEDQERKRKEAQDLRSWEILQRHRRNDFDKQCQLDDLTKLREMQAMYGKMLKIQMDDKKAEREKAAKDDDWGLQMNVLLKKANEAILSYGDKVLKESEGVRPTYPIAKTIENFKREIGMVESYNRERDTEAPVTRVKKKRDRRLTCTEPIKEENLYLS